MSLLFLIILLFSVVIHEYMHGRMADYLGDPTPRLSGRLTLNPLAHIDPIGTVIIPLFLILSGSGFLFGWAKPVPFDPFNLKNPRRDAGLISLVGPGSNLVLAVLASLLLRVLPSVSPLYTAILVGIVQINIILGLFNLIPVSPLDGFKVVGGILPEQNAREWYQLERYGVFFLLLLILPLLPGGGSMLSALLGPAVEFLTNLLIPSSIAGGIL